MRTLLILLLLTFVSVEVSVLIGSIETPESDADFGMPWVQ